MNLHHIWTGTKKFIDDKRMAQENEYKPTTPLDSDRE